MIELYKHITSGIAEYLLFLLIFLVTIGAFVGICKNIIDAIGEQIVRIVFAYKSQVEIKVKNPIQSPEE